MALEGRGGTAAYRHLRCCCTTLLYHQKGLPIATAIRDPATFGDPNPIQLGYVNDNHYVSLKPKEAVRPETGRAEAANML